VVRTEPKKIKKKTPEGVGVRGRKSQMLYWTTHAFVRAEVFSLNFLSRSSIPDRNLVPILIAEIVPKFRCKSAENRLLVHTRPTRRTSDNSTDYFEREPI
jgi:hypothetical protein